MAPLRRRNFAASESRVPDVWLPAVNSAASRIGIRVRDAAKNDPDYQKGLGKSYKSPDEFFEQQFERSKRINDRPISLLARIKLGLRKGFVPSQDLKGKAEMFRDADGTIKSVWGNWKDGTPRSKTGFFAPAIDNERIVHTISNNAKEFGVEVVKNILRPLKDWDEYAILVRRAMTATAAEDMLRWREALDGNARAIEEATAALTAKPTKANQSLLRQLYHEQIDLQKKIDNPLRPSLERYQAELKRLDDLVNSNPGLRLALENMYDVFRSVGQELASRGMINPQVRQFYFPQRTLDAMLFDVMGRLAEQRAGVPRGHLLHPTRIRAMMGRTGSPRDFSMDFVTVTRQYLEEAITAAKKRDISVETAVMYDFGKNRPAAFKDWTPEQAVSSGRYVEVDLLKGYQKTRLRGIEERTTQAQRDALVEFVKTNAGLDDELAEQLIKHELGAELPFVAESSAQQYLARHNRPHFILPREIAEMLKRVVEPENLGPVDRFLTTLHSKWKTTVLYKGLVRWQLVNVFGDVQRGLAQFGPKALSVKEDLVPALRDAWEIALNRNVSEAGERLRDYATTSSGRYGVEARKLIDKDPELARFKEKMDSGAIRTAKQLAHHLNSLQRYTAAREDVLRLAVARMNIRRHNAGKEMLTGVADKEMVRGLLAVEGGDPIRAAAYIARKAFGDYGDFTKLEHSLRARYAPFYSWLRINVPFWGYQLPKLLAEGGGSKGGATGVAALTGTGMAVSIMAAMRAWNSLVMKDAEDKLPENVRSQNHFIPAMPDANGDLKPITYKDKDGRERIVSIALPDAADDFLTIIGMDNAAPDFMAAMTGRLPWKEFGARLAEAVPKAPVRAAWSALGPIPKMGAAALGVSGFPDPFQPRRLGPGEKLPEIVKAAGLGGIPAADLQPDIGAGVFDIHKQLGYRATVPPPYNTYMQDVVRKLGRAQQELREIQAEIAGLARRQRRPQISDERRNALIQRQLRLRESKTREIQRLAERVKGINRTLRTP